MDKGYDIGFRLRNLSRMVLLVGAVILLGIPLVVFVVLLSEVDLEFAVFIFLILISYFVLGSYAFGRWSRAHPSWFKKQEE